MFSWAWKERGLGSVSPWAPAVGLNMHAGVDPNNKKQSEQSLLPKGETGGEK